MYEDILGSNLALELSDFNLDGNEQVQWFHYVIMSSDEAKLLMWSCLRSWHKAAFAIRHKFSILALSENRLEAHLMR